MNSNIELDQRKQHVDIEVIQQYFLHQTFKGSIKNKILTDIVPPKYKDICLTMAIEELSKLQKAICQLQRGGARRDKLIEAIVDVQVIIEWLKTVVQMNDEDVENIKHNKMNRILRRYTTNEFK